MADKTKIEWCRNDDGTPGATWNPITGCSVVSAGCKHCYAMKLAGTRLQHHPSRAGLTIDTKAGPVWTGEVRFNEQWLQQPLEWKRPRRIFVCAHGDLFHESVPDEWIDQVFGVMALAPQHTFQVLTKRPERMRAYLADEWRSAIVEGNAQAISAKRTGEEPSMWLAVHLPLAHVWLGVSVEDQVAADERIPLLLQCPAAVRWISAEPLLGPVNLQRFIGTNRCALCHFVGFADDACPSCGADESEYATVMGYLSWDQDEERERRLEEGRETFLDWVVAGGESGTGARPMHPDWARSLRDQCAAAGVAFLFKQWGEWAPHRARPGGDEGGDLRRGHVRYLQGDGREPDGHFRRGDAAVARVGKKKAGRLLNGVQHDGYPETRR